MRRARNVQDSIFVSFLTKGTKNLVKSKKHSVLFSTGRHTSEVSKNKILESNWQTFSCEIQDSTLLQAFIKISHQSLQQSSRRIQRCSSILSRILDMVLIRSTHWVVMIKQTIQNKTSIILKKRTNNISSMKRNLKIIKEITSCTRFFTLMNLVLETNS